MSGLQAHIQTASSGHHLSREATAEAVSLMMSGTADPIQIAGLLAALATKGPSVDELVGGAQALRGHMVPLSKPTGSVLDTCGTGGTGLSTVNISTASALLAAACGVPVAKHGNRAVTSKSGSSDVLQALGAKLDLPPDAAASVFGDTGFTFLLAPIFHPAVKHVAPVRAALKIRTLFNLLGPLANPAGAKHQLLGVADRSWLPLFAETLCLLGVESAWVVHGAAGEDEISLAGPTDVISITADGLSPFTITPEDVGLTPQPLSALKGGDSQDNAAALRRLFEGEKGAYHDAVVLNTGAALAIAGQAEDWKAGVRLAQSGLAIGAAHAQLETWIAATQLYGDGDGDRDAHD